MLKPVEAPYALALALKNLVFDRGWRPAHALQRPVVSVGGLSVGGAGKTPFVIELAQLLQRDGVFVDVLSRGYGRRSPSTVERVAAAHPDAARYGDEPVLLASATGVPVYVGASRLAAGLLAERDSAGIDGPVPDARPTALHLLDDGFQHRQIARSVDIVLLHPEDAGSRLLPVGRLREPLAALHRADFLVLRHTDGETEDALRRAGVEKPVWRVRREIVVPPVQGSAVAFCALAHGDEFFASLRAHGIDLRRCFAFRDHHAFQPGELDAIAGAAQGAAALLTTEKDLVRLCPAAREALARAAPLHAVGLRAELLDADRCLADLLALLSRCWPPVRE